MPTETWNYETSFAEFENIVAGNRSRFGYSLFGRGTYDDDSDVAKLIYILRAKVNGYDDTMGESRRKIAEEIEYKLQDLESDHRHTHRSWINYQRTSPGRALVEVTGIVQQINPEPEDQTEFRRMTSREKMNHASEHIYTKPDFSWVRVMVYGTREGGRSLRSGCVDVAVQTELIKQELKRVYEAIREEIGATQLYLQLINRYKMRCQWYNQDYLRSLVQKADGGYERDREDFANKRFGTLPL